MFERLRYSRWRDGVHLRYPYLSYALKKIYFFTFVTSQLTDIVTNFWDRLDCPPYIRPLNKCITPPSTLSTVRKNEGATSNDFNNKSTANSTKSPPKKQGSIDSELQIPTVSATSVPGGADVRSESPVPSAFNNRLSVERASINSARNFAESGWLCKSE